MGCSSKSPNARQKNKSVTNFFKVQATFLFGAVVDDLRAELENWLKAKEKIVIAGIGNPIRQDDYVGLKIVEGLQGKVPANVCLLECETVPESYLLDIEQFKPSHVLIIDAAFLGLKPGSACLFDGQKIVDFPAITTHVLPLKVFCDYVKQSTGAKIGLLLVEPKK
ncbi:MAG: hydrogenase maturation protease, partial [Ignavibacteria bacterium]